MAATRKIVAISDIHLGAYGQNDSAVADAAVALIYKVMLVDGASELVLLGDIFDLWEHPLDSKPPASLRELFSGSPALQQFGAKIRTIAYTAGKTVTYVRGNHDDMVSAADVAACIAPNIRLVDEYIVDGIVFAHGHKYDLANAPVPGKAHPIGYYVARCVATAGYAHEKTTTVEKAMKARGDAAHLLMKSVANLHDAARYMWTSILHEVLGAAPNGRTFVQENGSSSTLGAVITEHKNTPAILDGEFAKLGVKMATGHLINAMCGEYKFWGKWLCSKYGAKMCVFGHTHRWDMDTATGLFNCGRIAADKGTYFVAVCAGGAPVSAGIEKWRRNAATKTWSTAPALAHKKAHPHLSDGLRVLVSLKSVPLVSFFAIIAGWTYDADIVLPVDVLCTKCGTVQKLVAHVNSVCESWWRWKWRYDARMNCGGCHHMLVPNLGSGNRYVKKESALEHCFDRFYDAVEKGVLTASSNSLAINASL